MPQEGLDGPLDKHLLWDQPYRVELELQAAAALLIFANNHFWMF